MNYLFVYLVRSALPLIFILIALGVIGVFFVYLFSERVLMWGVEPIFLMIVVTIVFFTLVIITSLVLHEARMKISAPVIAEHGVIARATMLSEEVVSDTREYADAIRRRLVFKDPHKGLMEFTFHTDDNVLTKQRLAATRVYPAKSFIRYPEVHEEFDVQYLPGLERYFIILTTGNSPYAQALSADQRQDSLKKLESDVRAAEIRLKLDPFNTELLKTLDEAKMRLQRTQDFEG